MTKDKINTLKVKRSSIGRQLITSYLLIVIIIIGIVVSGFYILDKTETKVIETTETLKKYSELIVASDAVSIGFKTQVQEWKNLLIRGNNRDQYDQYYNAFLEEETKVKSSLESLKQEYLAFGFDTKDIEDALALHQQLGVEYKTALEKLSIADIESRNKVDAIVRGLDRPFTDAINRLIQEIVDNEYIYVEENINQLENEQIEQFKI